MPFAPHKRTWIKEMLGADDSAITAVEEQFHTVHAAVAALGVKSKALDDVVGETPPPTPPAPTPPSPPPTPPTPTPPTPPAPTPPTNSLLPEIGALAGALGSLATAMKAMQDDFKTFKESMPVAVKAAADDMVLGDVARALNGAAGHQASASADNIMTGMKEGEDDWRTDLDAAIRGLMTGAGAGAASTT